MTFRLLTHGYGHFGAHNRVGPSQWPHFDLFFVHKGLIDLVIATQETVELAAGDAVLLYPEAHFEGSAKNGTAEASIQHFALRSQEVAPSHRFLLSRRSTHRIYSTAAAPHIEPIVKRAQALAHIRQGRAVVSTREALLGYLLGELELTARRPSFELRAPRVDAAIAWANSKNDFSITAGDLAQQAGLSTSAFRSKFKRRHRITVHRFLIERRLQEAQRLLRETRVPIKQIAEILGYGDVVAFHRFFVQQAGETPTRYRSRTTLTGQQPA